MLHKLDETSCNKLSRIVLPENEGPVMTKLSKLFMAPYKYFICCSKYVLLTLNLLNCFFITSVIIFSSSVSFFSSSSSLLLLCIGGRSSL